MSLLTTLALLVFLLLLLLLHNDFNESSFGDSSSIGRGRRDGGSVGNVRNARMMRPRDCGIRPKIFRRKSRLVSVSGANNDLRACCAESVCIRDSRCDGFGERERDKGGLRICHSVRHVVSLRVCEVICGKDGNGRRDKTSCVLGDGHHYKRGIRRGLRTNIRHEDGIRDVAREMPSHCLEQRVRVRCPSRT